MIPRIDEALRLTGCGELADRSPYALSGGQQQRLAIASVIVMRPKVLVLDEPTSQLDPVGTREVFETLDALTKTGTTVVLAEHKLEWIAVHADRIVLLDGGRIVHDGRPHDVLADPSLPAYGLAPTRYTQAARLAASAGVCSCGPAAARHTGRSGDIFQPMNISTSDLTFTYPSGVQALRGVSLTLVSGESVAIVGENGAGKTTLVKHFNGLLRPTGGSVSVGEWNAATVSVARLASRVGYVFQNPDDQLFERSVIREASFGPRNLGRSDAQAKEAAQEALAAVGLEGEMEKHPYDLHLSQRKLLALAAVLAMHTPVIILDEPTTGQDATNWRVSVTSSSSSRPSGGRS